MNLSKDNKIIQSVVRYFKKFPTMDLKNFSNTEIIIWLSVIDFLGEIKGINDGFLSSIKAGLIRGFFTLGIGMTVVGILAFFKKRELNRNKNTGEKNGTIQ